MATRSKTPFRRSCIFSTNLDTCNTTKSVCDNTPASQTPTISASLNQTTHGQWFLQWFPTRSITHFFTGTQNTTKRVEEKNKRTNTGLVSSKCKKREVYVALLRCSPCICRLSKACILRETSTKPLGMLTHLLTALLTSSYSLLLLCPSLDSHLKPTVPFCPP